MRGVAKTKLTPDMLTLAGVSLCLAGAVLVGFEERNEKLFFWLGGALFVSARSPTSSTAPSHAPRAREPCSAPSSIRRSTAWARRRCSRRSGSCSCARGTRSRCRDVRRGHRLVPRQLHAREGGGTRPSRGRRLRLTRRAGRSALGRPLPRSVGVAAVADLRSCCDCLDHRRPAHAPRASSVAGARRGVILC